MSESDGRQALVQNWLGKAGNATQSASLELEHGYLAFAVNRCYYACFYAFTAVLVHDQRLYNKLFLDRQEGDYEPEATFDPQEIRTWILQCTDFLNWCKEYVRRP